MAYYRGKDIEKSRGNAMQEVILEKEVLRKLPEDSVKIGPLSIVG